MGLLPTVARFQEVNFPRVVEGRQQFVHASAEVPILATGPEEIGFPGLAGGQCHRLLEDLLFLFHWFTG